MGYRAANTGYGPQPKAWCDECGADIPLARAARIPRKPTGARLTGIVKDRLYRGIIPRPAGTALCKSCEVLREAITAETAKART
jgi:hypothetical protein